MRLYNYIYYNYIYVVARRFGRLFRAEARKRKPESNGGFRIKVPQLITRKILHVYSSRYKPCLWSAYRAPRKRERTAYERDESPVLYTRAYEKKVCGTICVPTTAHTHKHDTRHTQRPEKPPPDSRDSARNDPAASARPALRTLNTNNFLTMTSV